MLESSLLILGYWLLFFRFAYWIVFSFQEKKIDKKVFLAFFLEGCLLFLLFREFFAGKVPLSFSATERIQFIGFICIALGVGICFVAHRQLGEAWTHAASIKAKSLITTGIYHYVRNPIYTGLVLSYIGSQLLVGSWLWVSCLFFFIPAYSQAKKEERLLEETFGKKFVNYKKATKMFIPFLL